MRLQRSDALGNHFRLDGFSVKRSFSALREQERREFFEMKVDLHLECGGRIALFFARSRLPRDGRPIYIPVTVFSIRDRGDYRASRAIEPGHSRKISLKISSASLRRHSLQRTPPSSLQLQCRGESQLQSLTALHYTRGRFGTNERYVSSVGDLGGLCR